MRQLLRLSCKNNQNHKKRRYRKGLQVGNNCEGQSVSHFGPGIGSVLLTAFHNLDDSTRWARIRASSLRAVSDQQRTRGIAANHDSGFGRALTYEARRCISVLPFLVARRARTENLRPASPGTISMATCVPSSLGGPVRTSMRTKRQSCLSPSPCRPSRVRDAATLIALMTGGRTYGLHFSKKGVHSCIVNIKAPRSGMPSSDKFFPLLSATFFPYASERPGHGFAIGSSENCGK